MKYGREFYLKADVEYEKPPAPVDVDIRRAVGPGSNVKNLFGVVRASARVRCPTSRSTTGAWRDLRSCTPRSSRSAQRTLSRKRQRVPSVSACATTTTGR